MSTVSKSPITSRLGRGSAGTIQPLLRGLNELHRRVRLYLTFDAAARVAIWAIAMFWLTFAFDNLPVRWLGADELPVAARGTLLVITLAVAGGIAARYGLLPILRPISAPQWALVLERRFPQLAETLVTSVELAGRAEQAPATQELLRQTTATAEQVFTQLSLRKVLDYRPLSRRLIMAGLLCAGVGGFATLSPSIFRQAIARVYFLSDAPWPRAAYLEVVGFQDGTIKVSRGSDLVLQVRADATRVVPAPDTCLLQYRTEDGDRGRAILTREGPPQDGYQYYQYAERPFRNVLSNIDFEIVGLDFRLRDLHVLALDSPAFVESRLRLTPPSYTALATREEPPVDGLRVPQGTRVDLEAVANRTLRSVQVVHGDGREPETITFESAVGERDDDDPSHRAFTYAIGAVNEPRRWEFFLTDTNGLRSIEPFRMSLSVILDEPPVVDVAYQGIGTAVTPVALLPLAGVLRDDYAVSSVELRASLRVGAEGSSEAAADSDPQPVVWSVPYERGEAWTYALDLRDPPHASLRELEPGTEMVISLVVRDNCEIDEQPHETQLALGQLEVVRREELLAIIEGRELGLRRRFEQMVQEMREARDTLVRLRADVSGSEGDTSLDRDAQELRARRLDAHARRAQPELDGMAASYADISLELINNRVDSPELQDRIDRQLVEPLETLSNTTFPQYAARMKELREAVGSTAETLATDVSQRTAVCITEADEVLLAMQELLSRMLQLEDFNELIDLVREMLREQEGVLDRTEELRKKSLLDLLDGDE